MNELLQMSALSLQQHFAMGELSPVDVTSAALEQQMRLDPVLNASYLQTPELALEQARASEQRWLRKQPLSVMDGIPTAIKDGLWWKGHPVYRGFAGNSDKPPIAPEDAPTTARMAEGGMVFIGKSTMPDFGMLATGYASYHGVTRNPYNLDKTPGGSSAGAAAALTAGYYPVAVGTDIVGSIRLPASFCGLFGLKPSQGRVPYYPPASPALVAGPMTRTVADAAALMDLLSKEDLRDCTALPAGDAHYHVALHPPRKRMTLGLMIDCGQGIPTNPDVENAVRNAAKLLEDAGHRVVEIAPPLEPEDIAAASCWYQHRVQNEMQRYSEEQQLRSPYMATWIGSADKTTAAQLFAASERMWDIRCRLNRLFEDIDFLLCPTVPYTAFDAQLPARDVNDLFEPWVNVYPFNLTENPASSINCGFDNAQMPVGLQIIGRRFDDLGVLQLSREFEEICPDAMLPVREPT